MLLKLPSVEGLPLKFKSNWNKARLGYKRLLRAQLCKEMKHLLREITFSFATIKQ